MKEKVFFSYSFYLEIISHEKERKEKKYCERCLYRKERNVFIYYIDILNNLLSLTVIFFNYLRKIRCIDTFVFLIHVFLFFRNNFIFMRKKFVFRPRNFKLRFLHISYYISLKLASM